jgi:hypothetical protein
MCKHKLIIDECGCFSYSYPFFKTNVSHCLTKEDMECVFDFYDQPITDKCIKKCPLECETVSYEIFTSFDSYPNPGYYTNYLMSKENLKGLTYNDFQTSMAGVYIYYEYMRYTFISENPSKTIVDLLSSVGGKRIF